MTDPKLFSLGLHWSLWKFAILSKKNTITDAISTCKWKYITVSDLKHNLLKKKNLPPWMEKAKFFKKIVQCLLLQLEKKMYLRSWVTLHGSIQEPHQKILFFSSVLRYQHSCKPFSGKVNHLLMKHHHLGSLMTASRSSFQYIMF